MNGEKSLASDCRVLADEVEAALKEYAIVKHPKYGRIYAFEVDGFGNAFLMDDANIQAYIDDQNAVPCKDSEFELAPMLDGMLPYIESGNMTDYQDHYYPSEMAADALIQTYLINGDVEDFLNDFDTRWQRYNRDIIRAVQEYNEEHGTAE